MSAAAATAVAAAHALMIVVVMMLLSVSHQKLSLYLRLLMLATAQSVSLQLAARQAAHAARHSLKSRAMLVLVIRPEISRLKRGCFALGFAHRTFRSALVC
jgi:hypothetical protein